jgi:hypothetical protein
MTPTLWGRWQSRFFLLGTFGVVITGFFILEGLFVCLILYGLDLLPALPSLGVFWLHYASVWVTTFLASQSLMRLLFPRWRYRGGRWM